MRFSAVSVNFAKLCVINVFGGFNDQTSGLIIF